jgi:hypothetical protein
MGRHGSAAQPPSPPNKIVGLCASLPKSEGAWAGEQAATDCGCCLLRRGLRGGQSRVADGASQGEQRSREGNEWCNTAGAARASGTTRGEGQPRWPAACMWRRGAPPHQNPGSGRCCTGVRSSDAGRWRGSNAGLACPPLGKAASGIQTRLDKWRLPERASGAVREEPARGGVAKVEQKMDRQKRLPEAGESCRCYCCCWRQAAGGRGPRAWCC